MNVLLVLLYSFSLFAQSLDQKVKEDNVLDYTNIKSIIKNDKLDAQNKERKQKVAEFVITKKGITIKNNLYPKKSELFSFASQVWMAKNAPLLKFDMGKKDFGVATKLKDLLQELGLINKTVKILYVKNPEIYHFSLPAKDNIYFILLSLPFLQAIGSDPDDISLLIAEQIIRADSKVFEKRVAGVSKIANMPVSKTNQRIFDGVLGQYSSIIFNDGYSFQEQHRVTKSFGQLIKNNPAIYSRYIRLLNKLDKLVKEDKLFGKLRSLYPSPQMQIKWLSPSKPIL